MSARMSLLRPGRALCPSWVHERRSPAVRRRPYGLLAVAQLPSPATQPKGVREVQTKAAATSVVGPVAGPDAASVSSVVPVDSKMLGARSGTSAAPATPDSIADESVRNWLEKAFALPGQEPSAAPAGAAAAADQALLATMKELDNLAQFNETLGGLVEEFNTVVDPGVLEKATARVQRDKARVAAKATRTAGAAATGAKPSRSLGGASRAASRPVAKGLTGSTRTTRAQATAAGARSASSTDAAGDHIPNVLIRSTTAAPSARSRRSVSTAAAAAAAAPATAAAAAPAAAAAAPSVAPAADPEEQLRSRLSSNGTASSSRGAAAGTVAGARARASARSAAIASWGRAARAPTVTGRLKKAELAREAKTNPAAIMKSITQRTLLSAEQERQLAAFVQPLVELEKVYAGFVAAHRRAPSDVEWAAEAGMGLAEFEVARQLGTQAREHMVNCNIRLVSSIAKKYLGRGMDLQDMVAEGVLGLRRGVEKFDPSKGFKFSTYAHWWIRQAITRSISDQGRVVRLPVHLHEAMSKVRRVEELLQQELGRHPTEEEVAVRSGMSWAKLNYLHKCFRNPVVRDTPSLLGSEARDEGEERGTAGMEEDEDQDPARVAGAILLQDDLNNVLLTLTDREAGILRMRFGLDDGVEKTLEEVGRAFNVTRERIRQIESKAIRKLRSPSRMMQLCSV